MTPLEYLTVGFLIVVFVGAEVYRVRSGRRGVLIATDDSTNSWLSLPVTTVRVRLDDGREVAAKLSCCTACMGRLKVGDEVRLAETREGWVVDLTWTRSTTCTEPSSKACFSRETRAGVQSESAPPPSPRSFT